MRKIVYSFLAKLRFLKNRNVSFFGFVKIKTNNRLLRFAFMILELPQFVSLRS